VFLVSSLVLGVLVIIAGNVFTLVSLVQASGAAPLWTYWAGVAANLGTTVFLAAVLVWFERQLTTRVDRVERQTTAIRSENAELRAETERLAQTIDTRLTELDEQAARRSAAILERQAEAVDALGEDGSRHAVLNAMRVAQGLGAIRGLGNPPTTYELAVPGGQLPQAPPIRIGYRVARDTDFESTPESLYLRYGDGDLGTTVVDWSSDATIIDVLEELRQSMIRDHDAGRLAATLRPEAIVQNLHETLALAVRRRQGGTTWITGSPVFELVAPGWVITQAGVESEEHRRVVIEASAYEHFEPDLPWGAGFISEHMPAMPTWVDPDDWARGRTRGAIYFEEVDPTTQF
jgi:hypothetical protein